MRRLIAGIVVSAVLLGGSSAIGAGGEWRHGRMEDEICERPRHFHRWHGIEIMPESCDG